MSAVTLTLSLRQEDPQMIARRWRGTVRAPDHDAYLRYVEETEGINILRVAPPASYQLK